jgi:tRNA threonylcarbamoyladenosine biosynthesis protein TsaE
MKLLFEVEISSARAANELGQIIGKQLTAGDVVELSGDLGAGKTTFTQGLGLALGIENITSPTFTISKIYPSTPKLIHIDLYRLQESPMAIFDDLDIESYLPASIVVVEWGKGFTSRLSESYLLIEIEILEEELRKFKFFGNSSRWNEISI